MNTHTRNQAQIDNALAEIKQGKHNTDDINYMKANTAQLVEGGQFETALALLEALAKARQAKTTNILWIGGYLKDVYFHEKARHLREKFDKILLEEMLFYYLKSCKLHDPGYQKIRDHIQKF